MIDINATKDINEKATIFADIILGFSDPSNPTEMQDLIDIILKEENTDFLKIKTTDEFITFNTALLEELKEANIESPEIIIDNLKQSLSYKSVKFTVTGNDNEDVYADTINQDGNFYIDKINSDTLSQEDALLFLDNLTDEQKADPDLFTELLDNKKISSTENYTSLITSIENILTALSEKSGAEWDIFKTNLTNALANNTPNIDKEIINKDPMPETYLEHFADRESLKHLNFDIIANNIDFIDFVAQSNLEATIRSNCSEIFVSNSESANIFNDNINNQEKLMLPDKLLQKIIDNDGDIEVALDLITALDDPNDATVIDNTNIETIELLCDVVVRYISNSTGNSDEKTQKFIVMMERIAQSIERDDETSMKTYIETMGNSISKFDVQNEISLITVGEHMKNCNTYAGDKRHANHKKHDDYRTDLAILFQDSAKREIEATTEPEII